MPVLAFQTGNNLCINWNIFAKKIMQKQVSIFWDRYLLTTRLTTSQKNHVFGQKRV